MDKKFFAILFSLSVFAYLMLSTQEYMYIAVLMPHFAIFSLAMFFIYEKRNTLKKLGIPGDAGKNVKYTIFGLIAVIWLLVLVNIIANSVFLSVDLQKDAEKVYKTVEKLPVYLLMFAIFFAPISEELFFRAYLTQRFGIVLPAVLFGLVHFAYGSGFQVFMTFLIGLILGYVYKKSESVLPCMIIHLVYNALAILAIMQNMG